MKQRHIDLDLIKVTASIMVIFLHLGNVYMRSPYFRNLFIYVNTGLFFSIMMRVCVPLFVMVSGYLFLSRDEFRLFSYYRSIISRILIPIVVSTLFYSLFAAFQDTFFGEGVDWIVILQHIICGEAYSHLWYIYMILGLYIVAPGIWYIRKNCGNKIFGILGVSFLMIGILVAVLFDLPWPLLFVQYIGYFMIGYTLKIIGRKYRLNIWGLIGSALLMLVAFFTTLLQKQFHFYEYIQVYKYMSPITILASMLLYWYMVSREWNMSPKSRQRVERLSTSNLIIYLVHQFYIDVLYHCVLRESSVYIFPIIFIPILSFVIYLVSYKTSCLIKSIKVRIDIQR